MLHSQKSSPHQWWEHEFCISSCERNSQAGLDGCWKTCSHQWLGRDFSIFQNNYASAMRNIDLTKSHSQHLWEHEFWHSATASKLFTALQNCFSRRSPKQLKALECLHVHSNTILNRSKQSNAIWYSPKPSKTVQSIWIALNNRRALKIL